MNLNKYTKAELISKIKEFKTNSTNSNHFNYKNIVENILNFKNLILKLTFIGLLLKVFKNYSIFRKIWAVFNGILVSIFGISLIDIFEIEIFSKFFHNLLDLFNNTTNFIRNSTFYKNILELFGKKVEAPIKNPSTMRSVNPNSNGNQESSKIIERFNKIIHNESEEIKEDTPIYKNKYVIIGGILVLSCLTWYFYDDIKPIGSSILAWINTLRSRPNPDPDDTNGNLQGNNKSIIRSIKDWWNKDKLDLPGTHFTSPSDSPLSLGESLIRLNKGKAPDTTNFSEIEVNRRILAELTGDKQIKFKQESSIVLQHVTSFLDKRDAFPDNDLKIGMYNTIRGKLLALSLLSPMLYEDLIKDNLINKEIERFLNLENQINILDDQSDTYEEVAKATIQEQDVWSDKALSPQLLSPLIQDVHQLDDLDLMEKVKEIFKEDVSLKLETSSDQVIINQQPEIIVGEDSGSNSDLDHYFSDIKPLDINKPTITDKDFTASHNVGLQTPIMERLNTSPLINKPSLSNLFEDTKNLFEDNPIDTEIDTSREDSIRGEVSSANENRSSFLDTFKEIISRRKDSPSVDKKDLSDGAESQQETEGVNNQQDVIDSWEAVDVKVAKGNVHERIATIDFKGRTSEVFKILILTNDGRSRYFNPHFSNEPIHIIKWDTLGQSNPDWKELDVTSIYIIEKQNTKSHRIYQNLEVKFLDSYDENSKKRINAL